ncbi:MAG: ornithine cyclodeaminase family protein [Oscillospiraceae bacterium]|nr:ornithine cyclodeaminase family protein [Oscillospiraceae bacterium]
MLFLNREDMSRCMNFDECISAMEKAYRIFYDNNFVMPHRPCIENGKNTLLYMPCFLQDSFGTKFLTLFPDNPKKNKPMIGGMMVLNDADSGQTKAIMHAGFLTALRTAANTGVMLKYLAPDAAETCGIVGAGTQGAFQTAFACHVRKIKTVYVYDPYLADAEEFALRVETLLGRKLEFIFCDSVEQLMENSDIILTATTSNSPVYPDKEELFKGKTVVAIGSYKPDCRECPDALVKAADGIYVDLDFAKEESGDLYIPLKEGIIEENKIHQLSDIMYNPEYSQHKAGSTVFIKTVGMALFDVVCGTEIYNAAREKGIGTELEF